MRVLATLAVMAFLLVPGCFGGDEEEPPTTTTPTSGTTPTTPTGGTGTGGNSTGGKGNTTGGGGNSTGGGGSTTPAPAPREIYNASTDFARTPAPGQTDAVSTATVDVPAGYKNIVMNVTFTPGAQVAAGTVKVALSDPTPTEIGSCSIAGPATPQAAAVVCEPVTAANPAAGAWTLTFTGQGTWSARVAVTVY